MHCPVLELKHLEKNFPVVPVPLYERSYQLPFLYHAYYRSRARVRRYLQYFKRAEKAFELLNVGQTPSGAVLDIGCDWGYVLMLVKSRFPRVTCVGIDIDAYSCAYGNELARYNGLEISLVQGNARQLPFGDNTFDFVVTTGTFEHVLPEWRDAMVQEVRRVLRPAGRFVALFPNPSGLMQRLKDFISEKTSLASLTKWLPNLKGTTTKNIRLPHVDAPDAVMSVTDAENTVQFLSRLHRYGFEIETNGVFIFMIEIIPNILFPVAVMLERVVESIPWLRRFCTTQYFSALNKK